MDHDDQHDAASKHAAALSHLGASKGGIARAEKLSPEERRAIAEHAAAARWNPDDEALPTAKYGSPDNPLRIGEYEIPCYVLDDGRRVLVQRGMMTALDMKQGTAGRGAGDRLAKFAATKGLKPFVSKGLSDLITEPIRFRVPTGGIAYGYEATALADLCEAVLASRQEERLHHQQRHIAARAEILVRAFARVGIIALVDEATGYQDARARDALATILERFIARELRRWVKTFPTEFYFELWRLRGWKFPPEAAKTGTRRPRLVGKLTNNIIYERLAPGVLDELRRLTPRDETGRLKTHFHRRLTEEVGHPRLREHLAAVVALMKASGTWAEFMRSLNRALPKFGEHTTIPLALEGGNAAPAEAQT